MPSNSRPGRLLRQSFLWVKRGVGLLLAATTLLLAGYYLGWRSVPSKPASLPFQPLSPDQSRPTTAGLVELSTPAAPASAGSATESAQRRVARLAKWLTTGGDSRSSDTRVTAEIAALPLSDIVAALAALEAAPGTTTVAELRGKLLLRWAHLDGQAAFAYWNAHLKTLQWPPGLASSFFERWAGQEAALALGGWKTLSQKSALLDYELAYPLRRIISHLAQQNLPLALQTAAQSNGDTEILRGLASLARDESNRNLLLNTFGAWADERARNRALAETVIVWAESGEQDAALQWLDQSSLPQEKRFDVIKEIGMDRFHRNYQEGADWLVAHARTTSERSSALTQVTMNWMQYDLPAAGQWLINQGLDDSAASAMRYYADKLTADFPEHAVVWAHSIPDPTIRDQTLASIENLLRQRHPDQVATLLGAAPLP